MQQTIGIGITTRNRRETANFCIGEIKRFAPEGSKVIIVDDCSDIPFPGADFRFESQVGIARAKNKCLELLEDCEHIILMDDDCYPMHHMSFAPFIESDLNHAMWIFDRRLIQTRPYYMEFEKPRGCLLYLKNICLQTIGGVDTDFIDYSYEHVNFSDRIFNVGLTPARYIMPFRTHNCFKLAECNSSVPGKDRIKGIQHNEKLYRERYLSTEFKPYK